MKILVIKILLGMAVLSCLVSAQSPRDCASVTSALEQRLEAQRRLLADWAGLIRYGSENTELPSPKPGADRVVFLGDEVTENWGRGGAQFFSGKPYLNRGISGQTTPQMLVRFRQDVIALKPKVVVILAGINDIAGNSGPATQAMIADNLMSMTEIAKANGIRVVLSSVLPAYDFPWRRGIQPAPKVAALNEWIKRYAQQAGVVYLDYYSKMVDARGGLPPELASDEVHPTEAGYRLMAPLAEAAIQQALSQR